MPTRVIVEDTRFPPGCVEYNVLIDDEVGRSELGHNSPSQRRGPPDLPSQAQERIHEAARARLLDFFGQDVLDNVDFDNMRIIREP